MKLKVALLIDKLAVTEWQRQALEDVQDLVDVVLVINCQNTKSPKSIIKTFFYHIIRILCLKNDLTKRNVLTTHDADLISFESTYDGIWQTIPSEITQELIEKKIRLVIKFGMGLLRIDEKLSNFDILSFHHGDPEFYRGRPAGFYEIYHYADRIGIMVQIVSNTVDAGEVLVLAHAKIIHYSYKQTARNFYKNSIPLLRKAIINYLEGKRIEIKKLGNNYKLPSNLTVGKFVLKLLKRTMAKIIYGALYEKKWNILRHRFQDLDSISNLSIRGGSFPQIDSRYSFYADPFFSSDGKKIRLEALNSRNGLGEIIEMNSEDFNIEDILLVGPHYSYPYSFIDNGLEHMLPEVASHSSPFILAFPFISKSKIMLKGLEGLRLVDASIIKKDGNYYLFSGHLNSAADRLYLYFSKELTGPYFAHPRNPIVIDPGSARMAGKLFSVDNKLYRFGQNNCYGYGEKITIMQIEDLSRNNYSESRIGEISFNDARGPHTLNIFEGNAILDFYVDKFSLLSGYRRLLGTRVIKRAEYFG